MNLLDEFVTQVPPLPFRSPCPSHCAALVVSGGGEALRIHRFPNLSFQKCSSLCSLCSFLHLSPPHLLSLSPLLSQTSQPASTSRLSLNSLWSSLTRCRGLRNGGDKEELQEENAGGTVATTGDEVSDTYFCSELVAAALKHMGLLPRYCPRLTITFSLSTPLLRSFSISSAELCVPNSSLPLLISPLSLLRPAP
jgi:hypothetical protein